MNNIKSIQRVLKELNYILTSRQKAESLVVFLIVIISAMFELLGVSAIIPFVEAVTNPSSLMEKKYIIYMQKYVAIDSPRNLLIYIGIALIIIYILKNIFMIYSYYIQYDYSSKISMELSTNMLSSYMMHPYEYFLEANSSVIIRGCTSDTGGVYVLIYDLIQISTELLSLLFIGIFLIYTDPFIAISVIILLGIVTNLLKSKIEL